MNFPYEIGFHEFLSFLLERSSPHVVARELANKNNFSFISLILKKKKKKRFSASCEDPTIDERN
jgi:hypothetical protein